MLTSDLQWERLKKTGMAPTKRASFGMVTHRDRAYLFGGVTDRAGTGDKIYSEVHDELYQMDLASQRWRPVAMKLKKTAKVSTLTLTPSSRGKSGVHCKGLCPCTRI